jgi:hypothetical protein
LKKALALLAIVAAGVSIAWMAGRHVVDSASSPWPSNVASDFPNREENESATRLLATVARFGDDLPKARADLSNYIRHTETPPDFLQKHANTIRTLRAQIVSNPLPVWPLHVDDILEPPAPPYATHMQLFMLFGADALAHRVDAAAWTDLHAAWILARSLWDRPEPMSVMIALSGTRVICSVAARLQPPAPAWWHEVAAFDSGRPLVHSIEYEAWATRQRADRYPIGESDGTRFDDVVHRVVAPIARPISAARAGIAVGKMHQIAVAAESADPCEPFVVGEMAEWSGFVRRFHRFRIEREGVDKFLKRDFSPASQCRNGRWNYDGKTLAFHGALPPAMWRATMIPLRYDVAQ